MPNYGLVSTSKFGSGSFFAPFATSREKCLRIDPVAPTNFEIASGEDFYISVWIRYGSTNVSQLGAKYPIIKYGAYESNYPGSGWEIGITTQQVGDGYSPLPYFGFKNATTGQAVMLTTTFNGYNGLIISPSFRENIFDHYEVIRTNGVITFRFNGINSTNTSTTYTGNIGHPVKSLADSGLIPADYRGIFVGSEQPYNPSFEVNGAYIDELFFARGVSGVQNYNDDGSINDGALATTVLLYKFEGNYSDTTGRSVNSGSINLVSNVTLSATVQDTNAALANLTSSASLIISPTSIKRATVAVTSTFTVNANTTRPRIAQASLTSSFTINAVGNIPKIISATLTSVSTLRATPNRYYPRPWYSWPSTQTNLYAAHANWDYIAVDNMRIAASSLPGGFTETLFEYGGQKVERIYSVGPTRNYIRINGQTTDISGSVGGSGFIFNLRIKRGSYITVSGGFGSLSFPAWDFNPITSGSATMLIAGGVNAKNLIIGRSGWNNELITSDPYSFGDQANVLGLYDAPGAADRTGIIPQLSASITSTFNLSANAIKAVLLDSQITSAFAQTTQPVKRASVLAGLTSQAQLVQGNFRTRSATANLSSAFTIDPKLVGTQTYQANLQAQTNVNATLLRIKSFVADITAQGFVQTAAVSRVGSFASITVIAHATTQPVKTARVTAALAIDSQVSCSITKFRTTSANLSATATQQISALKVRQFAGDLLTTLTTSTAPIKTSRITANIQANNTLIAAGQRQLDFRVGLQTTAQVIATAQFRSGVYSDFKVRSTLAINSANTLRAQAALQVNGFTLTDAIRIQYNPYFTLTIKPESRDLLIHKELRDLLVASETRLLKVHEETRLYTVKPETRVNKIKG